MHTADPGSGPDNGNRRSFIRGVGVAAVAGVTTAIAAPPLRAEALHANSAQDLKEDFGAAGDGSTDDTEAIQELFDRLGDPGAGVRGATVQVPPGDYRITDTITIRRFAGVVIGSGVGDLPTYRPGPGQGSAFRWDGPAGIPMFRVIDSKHVTFRNLMFLGNDANPPSSGLDFHRESTADSTGTNSNLAVLDCHFGVWTWSEQGIRKHALQRGIHFSHATPSAANNDQFHIERCSFMGPPSGDGHTSQVDHRGIHIEANQSIWGIVRSSVFSDLGEGLATNAQVTGVDLQFDGCYRDLRVDGNGPVRVDITGYYSERAAQLAKLHHYGALFVRGGVVQLVPRRMGATPGGVIDAFPSNNKQTIDIDGVHFTHTSTTAPRPTIRFGLDRDSDNSALGAGFHVRVVNCLGLYPDQCEFTGSGMYGQSATDPSRGCVEWQTRTDGDVDAGGGFHAFRNNLRGAATGVNDAQTTATLNTEIWQPPASF